MCNQHPYRINGLLARVIGREFLGGGAHDLVTGGSPWPCRRKLAGSLSQQFLGLHRNCRRKGIRWLARR